MGVEGPEILSHGPLGSARPSSSVPLFAIRTVVWGATTVWVLVVLMIGVSNALPLTPGDTGRWILRRGILVGEYLILGFLLNRALAPSHGGLGPIRLGLLLTMGVAVAGVDDWRQLSVPNRVGSTRYRA